MNKLEKDITPALFEEYLLEKAKKLNKTIVLPEGEEERILQATQILKEKKVANLILLGNESEIQKNAQKLNINLDGIQIINPLTSPDFEDYASTLYELRKSKGLTLDDAKNLMTDVSYFGTMMVYKGKADGMVSGAIHTTAHTIRPALQFIKTKPGIQTISGSFVMCFNGRVFVFADCAVNPNPTPEQLSRIATESAKTAVSLGLEPKIAFLSYATGNSAEGPAIDLVRQAKELTEKLDPTLVIDGPLQFDATINPEIAKIKAPQSPVAGCANVFIFPDLNCGNCCYKAVQQASSDCLALGPLLQGLNKPVNDLSRGCTVRDVVNTVALTALME